MDTIEDVDVAAMHLACREREKNEGVNWTFHMFVNMGPTLCECHACKCHASETTHQNT